MPNAIDYKNFQIIYDGLLDRTVISYEMGGFWIINQDDKKESYIRVKITDTVLNNLWKINKEEFKNVIQNIGILKIKIGLAKEEIPFKSHEEVQITPSNSDKDYIIQSYDVGNKSYTEYIKFLEEQLKELEERSKSIGFKV